MSDDMKKENRDFYDAELNAAEKFLTDSIRLDRLEHIPDGRQEFFVRMKWKDLVNLLMKYNVHRICVLFPTREP